MGAATGVDLQAANEEHAGGSQRSRHEENGPIHRLNKWWTEISQKRQSTQKNNDRIAVNLRHLLSSYFWIDLRGREVKATGGFAVPTATNRS